MARAQNQLIYANRNIIIFFTDSITLILRDDQFGGIVSLPFKLESFIR